MSRREVWCVCVCTYVCVLVFSDKECQRHLTTTDLFSVGGIKLFVKRNTFVLCCVCVSQISSDLTHTCTRFLSGTFYEVNFIWFNKGLIVRIYINSHLWVWLTTTHTHTHTGLRLSPWVVLVCISAPVWKVEWISKNTLWLSLTHIHTHRHHGVGPSFKFLKEKLETGQCSLWLNKNKVRGWLSL